MKISEKFLVNVFGTEALRKTGVHTIDELATLDNYSFKHHKINEKNFPLTVKDNKEHEFYLCSFSFDEEDKESIDRRIHEGIRQNGLHPANIQELMFFNLTHPECLRRNKIVALGSASKLDESGPSCPYASHSINAGKYLDVIWTELLWIDELGNFSKEWAILTTKPANCLAASPVNCLAG